MDLVHAAARALEGSDDALLYVLGDAKQLRSETLLPFRDVRHLNLNVRNLSSYRLLSEFTALRTLIIQGSGARAVPLGFLSALPDLTDLAIPAAVRDADTLASAVRLRYLSCSSNDAVLQGLTGHSSLEYLDINFGTNRDLGVLPTLRSLRGLAMYQIRSLTSHDLAPIGDCAGLTALSLGALRNVIDLSALRGTPRLTLRALLLENLPNLENLDDVGACAALLQLGVYDCRPKDKSLRPLRRLTSVTHLALGGQYPESEIAALTSWYDGALHYRDIQRGEFKPRWRTPIKRLA